MDAALRQCGTGALKSYSPARYVYFLESLTALAEQLTAARSKNKDVGAARGTAASRREAALIARDALLSPLHTFAGERTTESTALDTATGTIDSDDRLGESLADLAALAQTWLALTDEDSVFLAASAGLTADLATAALTAAKALMGSAADAKLEGYVAGNDPPLVNLAEGGVLLEMREAMRLFKEAHARYPAVKKLALSGPVDTRRAGAARGDHGEEVRRARPEACRAVRRSERCRRMNSPDSFGDGGGPPRAMVKVGWLHHGACPRSPAPPVAGPPSSVRL